MKTERIANQVTESENIKFIFRNYWRRSSDPQYFMFLPITIPNYISELEDGVGFLIDTKGEKISVKIISLSSVAYKQSNWD